MTDEPDTMSMAREADALAELIRPMLADRAPGVVGAVLGELGAIFIASHAPSLRATARSTMLDLMDALVAPTIEQMIEAGRVGAEWRYEQ